MTASSSIQDRTFCEDDRKEQVGTMMGFIHKSTYYSDWLFFLFFSLTIYLVKKEVIIHSRHEDAI